MLADHPPILPDLDPLGVGPDLDRTTDRRGRDRVFVAVEAHEAGLGDRRRHRMEAVEPAGVADEVRIIGHDAARLPPAEAATTLVFLDPPYGKGLGAPALAAARAAGWVAPGALVVWEDSAPQDPPEGFTLLETRRYGDTHVTLLEAVG